MASDGSMIVRCECGARLKAPAAAAGRRVRCPKCDARIEVPRVPVAAAPVAAPAAQDEPDSMLEDLLKSETAAHTAAGASGVLQQKKCPNCRAAMAADAVLCLHCGHNAATGASVKQARAPKPAGSSALARVGRKGGRFTIGCVLSVVAATIGSVIWVAVAMGVGFELGYIAWGIGILAGLGMMVGYGNQTFMAGLTAAGIALAALVGAKVAIFVLVIQAFITGDTNNTDLQRLYLANKMTQEDLDNREIPADEWDAEWEKTFEAVCKRVENMDEGEVRQRWQEFKDADSTAELEGLQQEIASRLAYQQGTEKGFSPWADERQSLYDAQLIAAQGMSREELEAAYDDFEAWESEGRLSEIVSVRAFLIDGFIDEDNPDWMDDLYDDEGERDETASEVEWKRVHAAAVARVDALSEAEQRSTAARMQVAAIKAQEERLAEIRDAIEGGDEEDLSLAGGFFSVMFGPIDGLFIILAVVSAFKLGSGASEAGD